MVNQSFVFACLRRNHLQEDAAPLFGVPIQDAVVGLAENQWDFTKPDSVPGFGTLELTPELRRMLARLLGSSPQASQVDPPIDADNGLLESEQVNPTVCQNDNGNTQNDGNTEQTESRESVAAIPLLHRKHGGALPK